MSNLKETCFRALHEANGGRMVDFAGWFMPVQYSSIIDEHRMVRSTCGLFDVTHMGRIVISGPDHARFTDRVATNDRMGMKPGQIRYNLICKEDGCILDDVLVYASLKAGAVDANTAGRDPLAPLTGGGTMIVCNAGNHPKIASWLKKQAQGFNVNIDDISQRFAMLALQGPKSQEILQPLTDLDLAGVKYYRFGTGKVLNIRHAIVSRTGYTGEDGFELIFDARDAAAVFNGLMDAGRKAKMGLAGLGARDTLRLEAGMPLYGHEIDETVSPLEAGLEWGVKLDKDFIGADALRRVKTKGLPRLLTGLEVSGKRIARQGMRVLSNGKPVGTVASGTKSPTLDKVIATALVPALLTKPGTALEVEIKEGAVERAVAVNLPFYTRKK